MAMREDPWSSGGLDCLYRYRMGSIYILILWGVREGKEWKLRSSAGRRVSTFEKRGVDGLSRPRPYLTHDALTSP